LLWTFDEAYRSKGVSVLAGVDEAGRGPLAGGVFAAAAVLPPAFRSDEINDSKKLSEKKREKLFGVICENALAYGIASASVAEIEEINILNAAFLAMRRAVEKLSPAPELTLVDGDRSKGLPCAFECVAGGDGKSLSIAAASILAKVSRDAYMRGLAEKYPEYEFETHKGYGTKRHFELLARYGPSPAHRASFLRKRFAR
jgi:ribonuclease HII